MIADMKDIEFDNQEEIALTASADDAGQRLDAWLSAQLPELSRSRIQSLIRDGHVMLGDRPAKANIKMKTGQKVLVCIPPPEVPEPQPEDLPLEIVYEDEDIVVVNKAVGMVTHPAPGHSGGTLVNALLHHCKDLSGIGGVKRPGIVHRLDADTSGLLVVAKNDAAHKALSEAMERREISRHYIAVIVGSPREASGSIEAPIGRSRTDRTKMAIDHKSGRHAVTHWEIMVWGHGLSVLKLRLETGRTHQIRVHLASRTMPVVGDRVYGWTRKRELELIPHRHTSLIQAVSRVERQLLHAAELHLLHPRTARPLRFESSPPEDMRAVIEAIVPLASQADMEREADKRQDANDPNYHK